MALARTYDAALRVGGGPRVSDAMPRTHAEHVGCWEFPRAFDAGQREIACVLGYGNYGEYREMEENGCSYKIMCRDDV